MSEPSISYVTGAAVQIARTAGLDLRRDDWRDIVLAITDTLAEDGQRSLRVGISAQFVGPVRDGERWTIHMGATRFDVLYSPHRAMVTSIVRPREEGMAVSPAPAPRPLVGAA